MMADKTPVDDILNALERGETYDVTKLSRLPDLGVVKASSLAGVDPEPREWLIENWLPVGCVTSFYGDGGVGKSLAALQAGIAISAGLPFFGMPTTKAKVLAVFCEDDQPELHRRLASACKSMSVDIAELDDLHWSARCGEGFDEGETGNLIATIGQDGTLSKTPLYLAIRKAAVDLGARLVILDNISHIFAGNENSRVEVTQFINLLNDLATTIGGAVLLLGHTAKLAGSEYSGSTGWNNAVRSRWIFERPEQSEDEEQDNVADARILRKAKANYAKTGDQLLVVWDDGAFKREMMAASDFVDALERKNREREVELIFLACLDELTEQERNVSHSETSPKNFAPKIMARMEAAKGTPIRELRLAMDRLFDKGELMANQPVGRGKNRTKLNGIARK